MVRQATLNSNRNSHATQEVSLKQNASHIAKHAIDLVELQLLLLTKDLRAASNRIRAASLLLLVALGLLIAAAPVLLFALAEWLQAYFEWSPAFSLMLTGFAALLLSLLLLVGSWTLFRGGLGKFSRSREECLRNLKWAKQIITCSSDADAHSQNRHSIGDDDHPSTDQEFHTNVSVHPDIRQGDRS